MIALERVLAELPSLGLGALEAAYPGFRAGRIQELRALATQFGLAVTGGSDCHGPTNCGGPSAPAASPPRSWPAFVNWLDVDR